MKYELYYNNKSNIDWQKYVGHIYNVRNRTQNNVNGVELKNISILSSPIFSYKYYNVISIWKTYKYIKQAAIIEAIREAYKNGYKNILIISDEVRFINAVHIDNVMKTIKGDVCIMNPSDISQDCLYLNKYAINYIANLDINFSDDWLQTTIDSIKSNLKVTESYLDLCYHKIDYVVTYVNSDDPEWQKEYEQYKSEANLNINKPNRWTAHDDLFKTHLDNVRKYMPWVNNIYLVVSSESQIPSFVEPDINIVLHKDIIPTEYLPTFNSCAIEMYLHNIPNLCEHFIYANDDTLVLNEIDKCKFYHDGKICANTQNIDSNTVHHRICKHGENLINIEFNKELDTYVKFTHTPHPFLLSTCKHIVSIQSNNIQSSITRFRNYTNYNQYLFLYYEYLINNLSELTVNYKYVKVSTDIQNISEELKKYNNYDLICFNDVNTNIKIDLVLPYVDSDDPIWKKIYNLCIANKTVDTNIYNDVINNNEWVEWSTGEERFRSNDLLKYVFRSIETNVKFINNVYFLVMCESQVPKWLNTNKVKIIYHKDFIPAEFLPTFNSSTIEMFLHNIPGLSEYFIYGNDDMFFTSENLLEDYFCDKIPIYQLKQRTRKLNWVGDILRYEDKKLLLENYYNYDETIIDEIQHIWTPYVKSTIKECFDKYKDIIYSNSTKFREKNNYNQWLFSLYQSYFKEFVNKKLNYFHTEIKPEKRKKYDVNWTKYKAICLNDSVNTTKQDLKIVNHKFEVRFPNKSKYEI